jgi:glutathionyl-hydroquinone reductase
MANTNKAGKTANKAYERNMEEVYAKLDKIRQHLNDSTVDSEYINWGHVGSAVHINELLSELGESSG